MVKQNPLLHPKAFAIALAEWFVLVGRDYPWRRTTDPYAILVSEVMLQQTQIPTVLDRGYFTRWMALFPDFATLANATEPEVLKAWEGLGYYRRARNLQKLAQTILTDFGGSFPRERATILQLPGIGPYTAGAVASFAFDEQQPIVDGNVARVLSRLLDDATPIDSPSGLRLLWANAETLVKAASSARIHNSALMELGQTICKPTNPTCNLCPVNAFCLTNRAAHLPVKAKSTVITETTERVLFYCNQNGVLLLQEDGSRRTGLWKLPALPDSMSSVPVIHKSKYTITRYRVTLWVHESSSLPSASLGQIIPLTEIPSLPMPSPYRRALNAVLKDQEFALE
jgi:A/G-specific adenine glycosylase